MKKRILSILLAALMVLSLLPAPALAEDGGELTSAGLTEASVEQVAALANDLRSENYDFGRRMGGFTWDTEGKKRSWTYYNGIMMDAYLMLDYDEYFSNVNDFYNANVSSQGRVDTAGSSDNYYRENELDSMPPVRALFDLLRSGNISASQRRKYEALIWYVYDLMTRFETVPGTDGNFIHKMNNANWSTYQVALDGLYMAQPFFMELAKAIEDGIFTIVEFTEPPSTYDLYSDVVSRMLWIGNNLYDESTGLYNHGWGPSAGVNGQFWLRAVGWYAAALADVISMLPEDFFAEREELIAIETRLFDGMLAYQDEETGMWYNVINYGPELSGSASDNKLESSGSALLAYAMLKSYSEGYVGRTYGKAGLRAFNGTVTNELYDGGLHDVYISSGVGTTPESYLTKEYKTNEAKGVGPLMMAACYAEAAAELYNQVYSVSTAVLPENGGSVTAEPASAAEGETVILTVDPETGYVLQSLTVDGTDVTADVNEGSYAFNMPDHDVTVTATFVQLNNDPVELSVVWIDAGDADGLRADSLTIRYRNSGYAQVTTVCADESGLWNATLYGGVTISDLTVDWDRIDDIAIGYSYAVAGDPDSGFTITMRHCPQTLVTVAGSVFWDDDDNFRELRPDSVTIHLLKNGEECDSTTATEAENWSYSFGTFNEFEEVTEDGVNIYQRQVYTVEEDPVAYYSAVCDGFNVTNVYVAPVYACIIDSAIQHGTVTADPAEALEGETVILTVAPETGYALQSLTVDGTDVTAEVNEGTYAFDMPDHDVTVTAAFLRDMSYDMYVYLDDIPTYEETARFPYTGDPIEPTVRVEDYLNDDEVLTPGTDYEVSYSDNTGSPDAVTEAAVTITGIGAYTGSKTVSFRIIPDGLDVANCELKGALEAYYDADQYQAVAVAGLEVWYGDVMLERDVDYCVEVEWVEEYEVGETYWATITGTGDWTGEITCEVELIELSHPVVFVANGGSGSMDDDTVTLTNYTVGYTYTLPPCGFDPAYGMKFDHWEVYYEGIDEDPIKQPGEYFTAPFIWNESFVTTVTVTAIWTERAENEKVTLTAAALDHGSLLLNGEPAALTDGALSLFGGGQITVVPNAGYLIDSVSYNDGSDHSVAPDEDGAYSFTMPEADATLTVTFDYILATAPTIDTQPADLTLTYGYAEGALTVAATGLEGQPLSYQWYACDDADGTNPQAIDGAADASFTVPAGKNAGTTEYFFCVVTATREDNGDSADTATNVAAVTVEKADFYAPEELPDVTQYVPGDKAGSYSLALPALPEGAAYSFTLADGDGLIDTAPEIDAESVLTFAANSGKDAGTTAVIAVTAAGAPNYNDYGFDVNVVVSAYTVEYAWPEQTSIWLDADDQLAWSAEGITLDESRITVMQDGEPVTDFDFAVEGNGEVMEPGPNRIRVTGDGLDDWVDFTVIELIEDDPGFILDIPDWNYPDVAHSWQPPVWDEIVGSLTYDGNTVELTKDDISRGDGIDDGSLKLWYENADKPHKSDTVFLTKELTIEDFYYVGGGWDFITPFGSVVDVGNHNVYLPDHVTVKQLLDEAGDPVPAGDNGGTIYYMCDSRPDLHVEQSESEVDGETVTVLTLYNGDTPVQDGYYFRYGDDFYYGNGENAYRSYGGDDGFLSFWPVKSYANGSVYPLGDKPVTQAYDFDENGDPVYVDNSLATGNYNKKLESHYEARPDYRDTVYVGGNYFYYESMGFLYTGNITPAVSGSTISFGDYQIDMGTGVAIAWLPNDTIDGSGATDVWNCPHAYARYKADDFHYQIADQEFIIYPNNSLITIKNNKDEYHVGDDAEIVIELRQLERGMSVFVNGDLYERFEGYGDHTLTLANLHEGTYTIDVFGDGDDCVTGYTTHTSFTVIPNTITVTQQPADASAPLGELASTTVVAEGEGLTYQWYFRNAGAEKWSKSIYTGDTYTLNMRGERNGREVYCVITDESGSTFTTRTATLSIELPEDYVLPAITQQPSDSFVAEVGGMTDVTVAATGYGELSYQWYYRDDGTEKWIKSSLRSDNYDVTMKIARDGRQVYCVVSDAYGFTATSETATIGYAYPDGYEKPSITAQSGDVSVEPGEQAVATVTAAGDGELSYQWYYRNAGKEKWTKSIYTDDTYILSMRAARDGRQVYCVVTDRYGAKAESEIITLGMIVTEGYTGPAILTGPADASAPEGELAVTTVAAEGEGELTYQWYYRNAGKEKWIKSIYTGDTYTLSMTETRDGRQVYCVVTDRYGYTITSQVATLTIDP